MSDDRRFHELVAETCRDEGIKPPKRIRVIDNPKRRASATSFRIGRLGSGFIFTTQVMVDDLTDEELGVVVRHELAHYRHAEARWSFLQTFACFSPLLVVGFGWPLKHVFGGAATIAFYALSLVLHVAAFKSKRWFEARTDRESVHNAVQARAAQRALLKFGTLKERTDKGLTGSDGDAVIADFERAVQETPRMSDRIFNAIWGIHPLLRERLARYEEYAS